MRTGPMSGPELRAIQGEEGSILLRTGVTESPGVMKGDSGWPVLYELTTSRRVRMRQAHLHGTHSF